MKIKLGVVSGVISATELESEESERFHFLPTPLTTPITMHVPTLCNWFGSSASASDSDNLVFTRS